MMAALALDGLIARWRERAECMRGDADVRGVFLTEKHARELEEWLRERCEELVGLQAAGKLIDRSPDSVARMIRQGKLLNYGASHRPRVRVGDLLRSSGDSLGASPHCGDKRTLRECRDETSMSPRRIVSSVITSRRRSA
jgi:hypothetical protein